MLFLDWCEQNRERGPRLLKEWTGLDENRKPIDIKKITHGSHKKVLWQDEFEHEWVAEIKGRINGRNCPECARKRNAKHKNSLSTWCSNNTEQGQIIINGWTGISEDGQHYTMNEVSYGSNIKMLWRDEFNHEWYATINCRTLLRHKCPYCSGNKVSNLNSLSTWCLNNKEQGQIITNQWTGICEDGKYYTMDEVSYASHLKMLWRDEYNHEWYATIANRTNHNTGCPHCNKIGTSYSEQYIYWALKQLYPETQNRCVVLKDTYKYGIEYDIIIPDIPLAIEYSPTYWHKGKEEKGNLKKEICNKCNIRFIQIIEDSYDEYKEEFTENYIYIPTLVSSNKDNYLLKIVSYILNSIGHSIEEIDIDLVKKNALEYSKKKIEYEKSIEFLHPELAKEWHESNIVKPSEVSPGSHIRIKFLCPNCKYGSQGEWETRINARLHYKSGCPNCSYNWYKAETNQPQNIKYQYRKIEKIEPKILKSTVINNQSTWTDDEELDF